MLGHKAVSADTGKLNTLHPIRPSWIKAGYQQQQKQQEAYKFIETEQLSAE